MLAASADWVSGTTLSIIVAGLFVGAVVGLTGMGGGALMTPALLLLGVGDATSVVTADLTAAAVYKAGGALTHWRKGKPNFRLARFLITGSVPFALLGPFLLRWIAPGSKDSINKVLTYAIGFALLFAATTYALRIYIQLRRRAKGGAKPDPDPYIRPLPTILIGALGGLLVGITSVGSGSVIMIALLMLYPGLSPIRLVGTDLVQAVPLVLAAAISNTVANGFEPRLTIPLILGSVPGTLIGSRLAPIVKQSYIRRGIVVVLTVSGLALLDKVGFAPLGRNSKHPVLLFLIGVAMVVVIPFVWGGLRRNLGLPFFGRPTVAELEGESDGGRGTPATRTGVS